MAAQSQRDTIKFKKATTKTNLAKRIVEALEPPPERNGRPQQSWTYDAKTPHLAICVWSSGKRVWYWCGRIGNSAVRFKLGGYPDLSPENAKKAAKRVSADVVNGIDPRDGRRTQREDMKLGELFSWFLESHAKIHKKPSSVAEDERLYERYLKSWKSRRISEIKRSAVRTLHAKIGKKNGKYAANRMLSLLGTMFQKAIDSDDVSFEGANPARGIKRFDEKSRERFLRADELEAFFKALNELNPLMRDYFKIALLTGARRGNVQAMRWDELHLERGEWRVEDTKGNAAQTIHLPAAAVEVLRQRRETVSGEYVFPSRKGSKKPHVTFVYRAWNNLCESAGLNDIRPHDLRRSLGSWMAAGGASLVVIGKSLGHKNQSTTAIYSRLDLDPVKASVDAATEAMLAAAKGGNDADER